MPHIGFDLRQRDPPGIPGPHKTRYRKGRRACPWPRPGLPNISKGNPDFLYLRSILSVSDESRQGGQSGPQSHSQILAPGCHLPYRAFLNFCCTALRGIENLDRVIRRFWALMYWVFENTPIYKIFISENYCIFRNDLSLMK